MTMVVYGPMACGKTRNREALAAHFGLKLIVDDWDPARHVLTPGALHLTNNPSARLDAPCLDFGTIRFDPNGRNGAVRCDAHFRTVRCHAAGRWLWYAASVDEPDEFSCERPTREATIADALSQFGPGAEVVIIEAVMSQDRRYEGHDMVPFIRTRNRETVTLKGGAA